MSWTSSRNYKMISSQQLTWRALDSRFDVNTVINPRDECSRQRRARSPEIVLKFIHLTSVNILKISYAAGENRRSCGWKSSRTTTGKVPTACSQIRLSDTRLTQKLSQTASANVDNNTRDVAVVIYCQCMSDAMGGCAETGGWKEPWKDPFVRHLLGPCLGPPQYHGPVDRLFICYIITVFSLPTCRRTKGQEYNADKGKKTRKEKTSP